MHHKAIKAQNRQKLRIRYLNWHRLNKKEKKAAVGSTNLLALKSKYLIARKLRSSRIDLVRTF
jgi:hypothetical protein